MWFNSVCILFRWFIHGVVVQQACNLMFTGFKWDLLIVSFVHTIFIWLNITYTVNWLRKLMKIVNLNEKSRNAMLLKVKTSALVYCLLMKFLVLCVRTKLRRLWLCCKMQTQQERAAPTRPNWQYLKACRIYYLSFDFMKRFLLFNFAF